MRGKLNAVILGTVLGLIISSPAFCAITSSEAISTEYLRNHGYSKSFTKAIKTNQAHINGGKRVDSSGINFLKKPFLWFYSHVDVTKEIDSFGYYEIRN